MTTMKEINFGVEIETYGLGRNGCAHAIATAMGWSHDYMNKVTDDKGRTWKAVGDSSIHGYEGAEVVTPILDYTDLETLQRVVRALRAAGAKVNGSTGIHIHVDAAAFDTKALVRLVKLFARKEKLLKHAFEVIRSRGDSYCWDMNRHGFLDRLYGRTRPPKTLDELNRIWYDSRRVYDPQYDHYNSTRYHALNLHNVWFRGTVEFRLFNSTLHAGKVKSYVQFCLALAAKAINARSAAARGRYEFNPETARYETWWFLHELGLNGEEFKTCRTHLTKHLKGSSKKRETATERDARTAAEAAGRARGEAFRAAEERAEKEADERRLRDAGWYELGSGPDADWTHPTQYRAYSFDEALAMVEGY